MKNRILIFGTGLAGVGKTTHLKTLASSIPNSLYLDKDDINLELGQAFDANSDYYKKVIAPLTYRVMMWRVNAALAEGKVVICDGYFGNKLTSSPVVHQLQLSNISTKVIYFHCSAIKQEERLLNRKLKHDQDKEGTLFKPYRKQHLQDHIRELSQVPHLIIDTENDEDLSINIKTILNYLNEEPSKDFCFLPKSCQISEEECMLDAKQFAKILNRQQTDLRLHKEQENKQISTSKLIATNIPIKKVIILDAGVLQPDAEFGAWNQVELSKVTNLSEVELNQGQDYHALHGGEILLETALERLSQRARVEVKPSVSELFLAYKKGIAFYPNVPLMIRDLYKAGYQVVLLTNNSDLGLQHTRELLAAADLSCVNVYGSAELHLHKPNLKIFLHVCNKEQVTPEECWFVDDREKNREVAESLGMSVITFDRPTNVDDAKKSINACRREFFKLGILRTNDFVFPPKLNRGKYPSLFKFPGDKKDNQQKNKNNTLERYQPSDKNYVVVDEQNEDGNQRKRCLFESDLARLIVEKGRKYWCRGFQAINQLFLADFDLKSDPKRASEYKSYFDKIESSLKKEGLIEDKPSYDIHALRLALEKLFVHDFNLVHVSQFYYNVWLFNYGFEPLEPFVFLTDLLQQNQCVVNNSSWRNEEPIKLLQLFPNMANSVEDRCKAYHIAQPWVTCGPPQLRGRELRNQTQSKSTNANAETSGIIRDDDPCAKNFLSVPHFAAKNHFSPARAHPIAQEFQANAAPIIGGGSGTLGRNIYMLAPLLQKKLLSREHLENYVMGFVADLINRGHHSYAEALVVSDEILFHHKPWVDLIRDPIGFYEQLLTNEFLNSNVYQTFAAKYENFFHEPVEKINMRFM